MASPAHSGTDNYPSGPAADRSDPAFSALLQAAAVEFLSSLQLLAERARFLTGADGVAIALEENNQFIYRASAGRLSETGTLPDKNKAPIAKCLATAKASTVSAHTALGQTVKAAVPIMRHGDVVGFFELQACRPNFSDDDIHSVSGLAEMVTTALDHMRAAESAHQCIAEVVAPNRPENVTPLSWHAEGTAEPAKTDAPLASSSDPVTVHVCQSCGFPISDSRQLCVECERKPNAPKLPAPQLLASENEASWIATHGYALGSLLVTGLILGIIYWLR